MEKFIFDSNVYDLIISGDVSLNLIKSKGDLYITNVQISQVKNTTNEHKRNELLNIIQKLRPIKLNLDSWLWLDDLYWDDEQPWLAGVSEICESLVGNSTNRKRWML